MERIIDLAIEGKWEPIVDTERVHDFAKPRPDGIWAYEKDGTGAFITKANILMDPEFYKALGRQQGWNDESKNLAEYYEDGIGYILGDGPANIPVWAYHKARALAANDYGGSAEEYLNSVIK